jgi:hypothetical protein
MTSISKSVTCMLVLIPKVIIILNIGKADISNFSEVYPEFNEGLRKVEGNNFFNKQRRQRNRQKNNNIYETCVVHELLSFILTKPPTQMFKKNDTGYHQRPLSCRTYELLSFILTHACHFDPDSYCQLT